MISVFAATLAVISALTHAAWNALLKSRSDKASSGFLVVTCAMLFSALLATATHQWHVPAAAWPFIAITALLEGVYFLTLLRALSALSLSVAYGTSRGIGALVLWPLSIWILHERVSALTLVGAAVLSLGLLLSMQEMPRGLAVWWAIACGCMIGAYPVTYKLALTAGAPPAALFALSLCGSLSIQFVSLPTPRRQKLAAALFESPRVFVLAAFLCATSFLLWLIALQESAAAHVAALRNVSVLFAAIFSFAAGERPTARLIFAEVAIAAGAVLITWY